MHKYEITRRLFSLVITTIFLASPLLAQQRRNTPARKPAPAEATQPVPTFDTLLAADSYKVYFEVRGVGSLIHSPAVNDLLDPLMKLGGPAPEFDTAVKWLKDHAENLAGSRVLVAGWPNRPKLPNFVVAVEFSTPEEAKQFYPQLRSFVPTLLPATTPATPPQPPPTSSSKPTSAGPDAQTGPQVVTAETSPGTTEIATARAGDVAPGLPPYHMQQAGTLILISDTPFTFRNLRPRTSKPLEADQNFIMARNRFASESLFLYVDLKAIEREEQEQRKKWAEEEQKRIEREAANPPQVTASESDEAEMASRSVAELAPVPQPDPASTPSVVAPTAVTEASTATPSGDAGQATDVASPLMNALSQVLFGAPSKWPDAVSAAVVFEDEAYVLRTLIINSEENKTIALPFVPQFLTGPALVPESPSVLPADTEFFVSVSLDYPQMYQGLLQAVADNEELSRKSRGQVKDAPAPSPFAVYEAKLGLKIKDDILPLLGNELAFALPKKAPAPATSDASKITSAELTQRNARAAETNPILAIAIKDREAVSRLLPRIIESFGLKGASLLAQTEKREGAEITSYADLFAYAFVGNFLVVSPEPALTRRVVDAYLTRQTLSSDNQFRNFTRWQPRQVLGQVYVAAGLVEQYSSVMLTGGRHGSDSADVLSRINPVIDPLTYSLTNDGQGPLHELHLPKNLLQLLITNTTRVSRQTPLQRNESIARSALHSVVGAEAAFHADKGAGRYATLEELLAAGFVSKELLQNYGYTFEINIASNKFEATAIPTEYGKTGRLSFFIDESGVLRSGDHGGGAATAADQPE